MYVSMTPLLAEATRVGYTVGTFNAWDADNVKLDRLEMKIVAEDSAKVWSGKGTSARISITESI